MSVSKWRYTEECNGRPCPGDCDHCSFEPADLISRADAIEAVRKVVIDNDLVDALKALPSAEAEWIPCSERLPSEDGRYLVTYPLLRWQNNWISVMYYGKPLDPTQDVKGKCFYYSDSEWGDVVYDNILAWMPLPKPYREDGEE